MNEVRRNRWNDKAIGKYGVVNGDVCSTVVIKAGIRGAAAYLPARKVFHLYEVIQFIRKVRQLSRVKVIYVIFSSANGDALMKL